MVRSRATTGPLLYLEFFEDDIRRHDGDRRRAPRENLAVTRTVFPRSTHTHTQQFNVQQLNVEHLPVPVTVLLLLLSSEMFYHLIRHTSTILRRSCSPSSLSSLHHSPISRAYSWSGQSQPPANWGHLSKVYGKGVEMSQREDPMSPEASWTTQSRNRMQILRPPKGPYAGKTLPSVTLHDFLIYQSRKECRSEKRQRCRCTE